MHNKTAKITKGDIVCITLTVLVNRVLANF